MSLLVGWGNDVLLRDESESDSDFESDFASDLSLDLYEYLLNR